MTLHWTKEGSPRWDTDKQRLFGPDALASVGSTSPLPEPRSPTSGGGLATTPGPSSVTAGWTRNVATLRSRSWSTRPGAAPASAASSWTGLRTRPPRGLNYIYNVVPDAHPDAARMTRWLTTRGFVPGTGDLRRQVRGSDPGP
jgi:hypothetical protein